FQPLTTLSCQRNDFNIQLLTALSLSEVWQEHIKFSYINSCFIDTMPVVFMLVNFTLSVAVSLFGL
ncbi:hypothetical protein, partial [Pelorhabdus rhamnosifermentans]|uniref:hypothetical protein n=1 Tax=Pelorhabdus rhamnosifermentans TaxID=2772457 RepID=UPI001C06121C